MRKQPTIFPRRLPPGKCFDCGQETSNKYHPRCRPCGYARRDVLPEERFNKNVNKTLSCWLWEGCTNKAGYGVLNVHTKHAVPLTVHGFKISTGLMPLPEVLAVTPPAGTNSARAPGQSLRLPRVRPGRDTTSSDRFCLKRPVSSQLRSLR